MFRIIPEKVLLDNRLPDKAKFIMSDVISWSLSSLECFNDNQWFADRYGISKSQVSRLISLLVDLGYIHRTIYFKKGTKKIIKRTLIPTAQNMYSLQETKDIVQEKLLVRSLVAEEDYEIKEKTRKIIKSTNIKNLKKIWE